MSDKIYKVVLLGKIADGYDIEIVQEKLALVFDIDLKKIPKLLKKPTIIRKELTYDVAVRYQTGLEKIGVLCEIKPPLESDLVESDSVPKEPEEILETEEKEDKIAEPEEEVIEFAPVEAKLGNSKLQVVDVKMSFSSILLLFIKFILAAIPAMIILSGIMFLLYQVIIMIGSFI
ncbi:MAG: hypothetical protein KAG43_03565 [Candidatus Marithrix sp.]|nr:hypothetical protein [Candidatus Marithrix sp.]